MVNAGKKSDLRRGHGIVLGKEELEFETASGVRALLWANNYDGEETGICVARDCRNTGDGFTLEAFRLLSWVQRRAFVIKSEGPQEVVERIHECTMRISRVERG